MLIIKKLLIALLLLIIAGETLSLNAKEKKYDAVVKLGTIMFTKKGLNTENQLRVNEYFRKIKKYELKYKKIKIILIGDTSCSSQDEKYADNVEDMLIDKGLKPKQIKTIYIRAKDGYVKNCTQQKIVKLILKAKKLRKIKLQKPKIKMSVVLLQGRKKGTAIEVKTPLTAVIVNKPNEVVSITDDNNISKPEKLDTKGLQAIFGTLVETKLLRRYHFVVYFDKLNLDKKSQAKIKKVISIIEKIKNPYVKIIGHTDTLLSVSKNYKIGLKRAQYVADLIKKSGAKYLKMDVTSFSELNLAVKTPDETKEPLNRRVEIFIQ